MGEIKSGRARRGLSVGSLTTTIGGSYLWQFVKRPFQSSEERDETMLATHIRNAQRLVSQSVELRGAFAKLVQMLSMRNDLLPAEAVDVLAQVHAADAVRVGMSRHRRELARRPAFRAFPAAGVRCLARAGIAPSATTGAVAVKVQYPGGGSARSQEHPRSSASWPKFRAT
jgi:predicted unusual protein kinase regulating ubiquinone biosynthesis (AarF/ABC1/UbiB family)